MPRKAFSKNDLLKMDDALDILSVYLIEGVKSGIRFNKFYNVLHKKTSLSAHSPDKRKEITRSTIKHRLKQMVREGILKQQFDTGPYFLNENWHILPYKIIINKIMDKTDSVVPYIENFSDDEISIGEFRLVFGISKDEIPKEYYEEYYKRIKDELDTLKYVSVNILSIKNEIFTKRCKKVFDKYYRKLKKKDKELLDSIVKDNSVFYKDLMDSSELIVEHIGKGDIARETVEIFIPNKYDNDQYKEIHPILIDLILKFKDIAAEHHPFVVGGFTYWTTAYTDIEGLSERQIKMLKP